MKDAIQKAIEGGWRPQDYGYKPSRGVTFKSFYLIGNKLEIEVEREEKQWEWNKPYIGTAHGSFWVHITQVTSDPLFWQALGKALGWGMWKSPEINASAIEEDYWGESTPLWKWHWHCFIDHLASGKSADEFFNSFKEK